MRDKRFMIKEVHNFYVPNDKAKLPIGTELKVILEEENTEVVGFVDKIIEDKVLGMLVYEVTVYRTLVRRSDARYLMKQELHKAILFNDAKYNIINDKGVPVRIDEDGNEIK